MFKLRRRAKQELNDRQQTIIVGDWFSVCGNCGGNAAFREKTHKMKKMKGEGCGVRWRYITSDSGDPSVARLRLDLEYRDTLEDQRGLGDQMEVKMIGGMEVLGPVTIFW